MKVEKLANMTGGWFAGDFSPVVLPTSQFEAACKYYKAGQSEGRHVHRVATEITLVAQGSVKMNGRLFSAGDIVLLEPGDATDFQAVTDAITMVVKVPSVKGDKYKA